MLREPPTAFTVLPPVGAREVKWLVQASWPASRFEHVGAVGCH